MQLAGYQPLLNNGQYRSKLPRRNQLVDISCQKHPQELDKPWDAPFLLPDCRAKEEGQKTAIFSWDIAFVELEHLCKDLKYERNIFLEEISQVVK